MCLNFVTTGDKFIVLFPLVSKINVEEIKETFEFQDSVLYFLFYFTLQMKHHSGNVQITL